MSAKSIAAFTTWLASLSLLGQPAQAAPLTCPPHPGPHGSSASTPDGSYLVCLVDASVPGKYELYGVDGVQPPWRLSVNMADDRDVIAFAASVDRVVFTSDPVRWTQYELYSTPLSGSLPPVKLSGAMPSDNDVDDFVFSGDGWRVVYRKGRNATGVWDLWSTGVTGGGTVRLSQPNMSAVQRGFIVRGSIVRFAQDPSGSGVSTWYAAPVVGGVVWTEIFTDGFESGGVTRW